MLDLVERPVLEVRLQLLLALFPTRSCAASNAVKSSGNTGVMRFPFGS